MFERAPPRRGGQRIRRAANAAEFEAARRLLAEYPTAIGVDHCFQDFAAELAELERRYAGPDGGLWLAWHGALPVGCVALRPESGPPWDRAGELKRLYVRPAWQGGGVGRHLLEQAIAAACRAGYARLRLDTLNCLGAANRLYAGAGFAEIPPYNANALPGVRFLELALQSPARRAPAGKPRIEVRGGPD